MSKSKHTIGRRSLLITGSTGFAALKLSACTEAERGQTSASPATAGTPLPNDGVDLAPLECPATPRAYVFATESSGTSDALRAAGFDVVALPRDRSPARLRGVIVLPAFASEADDYRRYMQQYAADLYGFVDSANVLVQLAQSKASEESPPFLPTTHTARRGEGLVDQVRVLDAAHPLVTDLAQKDGLLTITQADLAVDAFDKQDGFEVVLADVTGKQVVLMEGAYGQGRFVLSALTLEHASGPAAALASTFFANLFAHVHGVCAGAAPELALTSSKALDTFAKGSQMLAVLPDTQVYSLRLPGLFSAQTGWIREHAARFDIRYVVQLGDLTNNNTRLEWERASGAFSLLDGSVPWAVLPGNHDYGPSGNASTRTTLLNEYFSYGKRAASPGFGGAYESGKLDNTYHLFSIGGRDVILLALEWGPRDEVIAWANEVVSAHSDRDAILATHAYLNNDDRRYDHTDTSREQRYNPHDYRTPGVNDGEELWQKLVRKHRFIMTLNGHVLGDGAGYLASKTDRGNTCHQMLSNYQMREQGGEGYLRLLEFMPDGKSVRVFTYSTLFDQFLDSAKQNFTITLD